MAKQRGATIILFAVMIPLMMCFSGLVIDLGNLYFHRSQLQNAADAAALAGGYTFVEENLNLQNHIAADEAARAYVKKNINKTIKGVTIEPRFNNQEHIYYRVIIKEEVPIYFLRYFPSIASSTEIGAEGCVKFKVPPNDDKKVELANPRDVWKN